MQRHTDRVFLQFPFIFGHGRPLTILKNIGDGNGLEVLRNFVQRFQPSEIVRQQSAYYGQNNCWTRGKFPNKEKNHCQLWEGATKTFWFFFVRLVSFQFHTMQDHAVEVLCVAFPKSFFFKDTLGIFLISLDGEGHIKMKQRYWMVADFFLGQNNLFGENIYYWSKDHL